MLGLDTLDVAIGLVFVYLMVSFVCSAAVELVEVFLKNRPKKLLEGITELLRRDESFVQKIYEDPLVNALFKGTYGEAKPKRLPSYIPARNFALALLNQLPSGKGNTAWERLNDAVDQLGVVDAKAPAAVQATKAHVHKVLKSALLTAQGDVDKALKGIEDWYNSSMDRVSGWFKRRTQFILLGFGVFCAIVYNVDTIYIVKRLMTDKALRAAVVASAGATVNESTAAETTGAPATDTAKAGGTTTAKPAETKKAPTPPSSATSTSTTGTTATTDTSTTAPPKPAENENAGAKGVAAAKDRLTTALDHLKNQGLPIGWPSTEFDANEVCPAIKQHALGWLLTAIAVSFGAPFWFDVLNKFMVVRSTVKPKEKSGVEKSKDAK